MSYAGAYDSGMMGSEAGTPFQPRHVVVLAELGDEEKAKYIEFLLENDVKVVEDRKGVFTANVRVAAPGYREDIADMPTGEDDTASQASKRGGNRAMPSLMRWPALSRTWRSKLHRETPMIPQASTYPSFHSIPLNA